MKLRFLSVAEREMWGAFDWYERQSPGLGAQFLSELDQAVARVRRYPESCPVVEDEMQGCCSAYSPTACGMPSKRML